MTMTRTERDELRRVVRQQFKVLRAEIEQRRKELAADAAQRVRARFADGDKLVADLNWSIDQIVDQAQKDIRALMESLTDEQKTGMAWTGGYGRMTAPRLAPRREDQAALNRVLDTGIDAEVHQALLKLERQEADLNRQLAIGAIESDEARGFLRAIPSVSDLVPVSRLAEIEARWDEEQDSGG